MSVKHITVGFAAHVDAGKTTICEQILFRAGQIRSLGQVYDGNTVLDNHAIEKKRGITVFCGESSFDYLGTRFHILDTPGHVDFAPQTERVFRALDCAVFVVSCVEGVQSHTVTLFRILERLGKPCVFFLNKTDRAGANIERTLQSIKDNLGVVPCTVGEIPDKCAESDEEILESYLSGQLSEDELTSIGSRLLMSRIIFPFVSGCARNGEGIDELLSLIQRFINVDRHNTTSLSFYVYRVTNDGNGARNIHANILSGSVSVRDEIPLYGKISYLREAMSGKLIPIDKADAGMLCVIGGLNDLRPGDLVGQGEKFSFETVPLLSVGVMAENLDSLHTALKILEDEEPTLCVSRDSRTGAIAIRVCGEVQLEIISELLRDRFGITIAFGEPQIRYLETIAAETVGVGHFEPLRHYAEVHLKLSPSPRGNGITFSSDCTVNDLPQSFQNLIKTHVFEREIRGLLTGSPVTDIHITLLRGAYHLKHTDGGDFREAVYRALRHGLEKAENILLEPYYAFIAHVPHSAVGKVCTDISLFGGECEYPEPQDSFTAIKGRAPMAKILNYGDDLRNATSGMGYIFFTFYGYKECGNSKEIIEKIGYDKDRDPDYTSSSVFCAKGAGFTVKWYDVESYMHLK